MRFITVISFIFLSAALFRLWLRADDYRCGHGGRYPDRREGEPEGSGDRL